jgi:hypothetical protein
MASFACWLWLLLAYRDVEGNEDDADSLVVLRAGSRSSNNGICEKTRGGALRTRLFVWFLVFYGVGRF